MSLPHAGDPQCQASSVAKAPTKRRRVLKWALIMVAVPVSVASLLLCWPVAHISQATAARITPGMTIEQAEGIVGAPPGDYDGVVMISTNEPATKGTWHEWTGSRGHLILEPDGKGRVGKARFYPALAVEQSVWLLLIERLSRSTESQWQRWWMDGDHA